MTRKQVVVDALAFRPPAYVPWAWSPTVDCAARLKQYLGTDNLADFVSSHFGGVGSNWVMTPVDAGHNRDPYGVVWDTTVDKDIGTPCDWPIKEPGDLDKYVWPDMTAGTWEADIRRKLKDRADRFTHYDLGFSLYERAWTMRGMENFLIDMVERPEWVEEFLDRIVEHNMQQIRRVAAMPELDCVYFGDDYGMQEGLIMGIAHWRKLIKPRLAKMFAAARSTGKCIRLHSCGCVESLFDDLVEIGLNVFNPFQPEVMDTASLHKKYLGRLAFHGGLSVQKVLPFGSVQDVRKETRRLIEMGRAGGYILSPSHQVPRDVPPQNLVAMMEELKSQSGYSG